MDAVRANRLARVRAAELVKHDMAGVLHTDPLNVRYTDDPTNMLVWIQHNVGGWLCRAV